MEVYDFKTRHDITCQNGKRVGEPGAPKQKRTGQENWEIYFPGPVKYIGL